MVLPSVLRRLCLAWLILEKTCFYLYFQNVQE